MEPIHTIVRVVVKLPPFGSDRFRVNSQIAPIGSDRFRVNGQIAPIGSDRFWVNTLDEGSRIMDLGIGVTG